MQFIYKNYELATRLMQARPCKRLVVLLMGRKPLRLPPFVAAPSLTASCLPPRRQERESAATTKPLRLLERSVFSDRMVFVRAVHEAKWMDDLELSVYDSWCVDAKTPQVQLINGLASDGAYTGRPGALHDWRRLQPPAQHATKPTHARANATNTCQRMHVLPQVQPAGARDAVARARRLHLPARRARHLPAAPGQAVRVLCAHCLVERCVLLRPRASST